MTKTKEITIALSKLKFIFIILLSLGFVALGVKLLFIVHSSSVEVLISPLFIKIIGGANILLFGLCAIIMLVRLFSIKPGLIINEQGITDNSSIINAGFIPWSDIQAIETGKVTFQKFVRIVVNNPENYIQKHTNFLARKNVAANFRAFRTPIQISAGNLRISFKELLPLLNNQLKEYQAKTGAQAQS